MSETKPVYLLAGGMPRDRRGPDPIMRAIFKESGKASPIIAYTGTASGDDINFFNRMAEYFREAGAGKVVHAFIVPDKSDIAAAKDILRTADIVFISGGDVERGINILTEKNMIDFMNSLYREGKIFFGSSAGAIMLAKEWVHWPDPDDESSAELFPCLGFAPVICDCHDEAGGWEELQAALRLKEKNTRGYGLVSGTGIRVFSDGRVEALGGTIHQYIRRGDTVDRISDIRPVGNGR